MDDLAFLRPPPFLDSILEHTKSLGFNMASEQRTGAMLRVLASSKPGGHFLELGTGTGISTAWLLDGMSTDARLATVDNDSIVQSVARNILGHDPRLQIVTEDGTDFVRRSAPESFDLIFADALPGKYEALDETLALLRLGGLYIIDDMLPQANWPEGHAAKVPSLLSNLFARTTLDAISMAWSSGLAIVVRKI